MAIVASESCVIPDTLAAKTKRVMKVMNFVVPRVQIRLLPISEYQAVSRFSAELGGVRLCLQVVGVM